MPTTLSEREERTAYICGRFVAVVAALEAAATGERRVTTQMAQDLAARPEATLDVAGRIYPLWLSRLTLREPEMGDLYRSRLYPLLGIMRKRWKGGGTDAELFRLGYLHQSDHDSID